MKMCTVISIFIRPRLVVSVVVGQHIVETSLLLSIGCPIGSEFGNRFKARFDQLIAETLSCGFSLGNFISTAEKIRLPDDCTIGYIIEALLEVTLTHTHLFHSHLENLQKLPTNTVLEQVCVCVHFLF